MPFNYLLSTVDFNKKYLMFNVTNWKMLTSIYNKLLCETKINQHSHLCVSFALVQRNAS